jgi:hypothetical protein
VMILAGALNVTEEITAVLMQPAPS